MLSGLQGVNGNMPDVLGKAIELHRQGRLPEAARLYEAILAEHAEHPEALHLLGLASLQQGDPSRAAHLIGRAVALRPGESSYLASLAEAWWSLGRRDRAVDCYEAALRLQPENAEYHSNLGATLVDLGRLEAAMGHLRAALRLRPDLAAAHNNLANALRMTGENALALEHLRRAVQIQPGSAELHSNLGELLLDRGEAEEAAAQCREALRLRPHFPAALNNLGNALHALGRLEAAGDCFREALRLQPGLASAHAGLAGVLEATGDLEQAEAELRAALGLDPHHAGALARLATMARDALSEQDRAAIESRLAEASLSRHDRWTLLFAWTQVLDARGEFDRAADAAREANALQRADFEQRGKGYDPVQHRRFLDRMMACFNEPFFDRVRGFGIETERPVFIVGLPRSGTTLTEQILASHPRVFGAGELSLASRGFGLLPTMTGQQAAPLECVPRLDRATVRELARRHLEELEALGPSADRIVDKMPENALFLGWIATIFPRATLIHCQRDPRDIALSCWLTHFGHLRWACDLGQIADRVNEHLRIMDHWKRVLPVPLHEVDYEDLTAEPERSARRLVDWCGLEWDPACLAFHETRRHVRTASAAQVRRPVHRRSVGRWRNYERTLATLFARINDSRRSAEPITDGGQQADQEPAR
jgi:tetratricopeptide (TPR) repeat protein